MSLSAGVGSKDGTGFGDHDVPYIYGKQYTVDWHPLMDDRQFARLMIFRSDLRRRREDTLILKFIYGRGDDTCVA